MKFLFYSDENEEAAVLSEMLSGWSGVSVESRAKQYGIPADVAALCGCQKEVPLRLRDFLHEKYVLYAAELKQSLMFHTAFWDNEGRGYVEAAEKIMQVRFPDYKVRLSVQLGGISDWEGTRIAANAFCYLYANKSEHIRIVLWETILSQTFQIIRSRYPAEIICDEAVWGISELTALLILGEILGLNVDAGFGDYVQLNPHIPAFKDFYQKRRDFNDYIDKTVQHMRQNPLSL